MVACGRARRCFDLDWVCLSFMLAQTNTSFRNTTLLILTKNWIDGSFHSRFRQIMNTIGNAYACTIHDAIDSSDPSPRLCVSPLCYPSLEAVSKCHPGAWFHSHRCPRGMIGSRNFRNAVVTSRNPRQESDFHNVVKSHREKGFQRGIPSQL